MTLHGSDADPKRMRVGMLFLAVGLVLLLWAWGSWVYRASVPATDVSISAGSPSSAPSPDVERAARASPAMLVGALLLVLVFLVGSYAIVRGSRRFREALLPSRPTPTASDDVWTMHKTPPAAADEDEG